MHLIALLECLLELLLYRLLCWSSKTSDEMLHACKAVRVTNMSRPTNKGLL